MIELSVIIPTYNRAGRLQACLESLSRQTQSFDDFEVIVVIDGATDNTREMLSELNTPYSIQAIWQSNSGPAAARNRGARAARGHYCIFIDDDIVADPGLIAEHLKSQRGGQGVIGIGQIILQLPAQADWYAQCFAERWAKHYRQLDANIDSASWLDGYSGNMSVPLSYFAEVGGFEVSMPHSEDVELSYRLMQKGLSVTYIPSAVGRQDERKGFRQLTADAQASGVASVELCRRHPPMLPQLLGTFADANMHEFLLRRILLTLKIPPRLLHLIGQLLAKERHVDSWYGFAQRYCYWRGVKSAIKDRETWQRLVHGTTILLYHSVGWPEESVGRYITESRRFRWQMALLNWLRYRVLSMEEYLRYRIEHQLPPSRSILITFDDGYADNYALAYPILRRHGFAATIFLVSRFLGSTNQWDKQGELSGRPLLAKSEVQEMQDGGLQFGAHSRTHALLTELSPELVCDEVIGSRNDLQADLGSRLLAFAYPYGEYNVATQATLEKAGFRAGLTAQSGMNTLNTPLHALRRTEVYGTDSLLNFMLALWTGHTRKVFRSRDN